MRVHTWPTKWCSWQALGYYMALEMQVVYWNEKLLCFQCLMGSGHLHLIRLCGFFVFLTSEISQDGGSSFAAIWGLLSFQKWTTSVIIYSVLAISIRCVCVRASRHWWHSCCTCERIKIQDFLNTLINRILTLELDQSDMWAQSQMAKLTWL